MAVVREAHHEGREDRMVPLGGRSRIYVNIDSAGGVDGVAEVAAAGAEG
jgi:hypothetical protein